MVTLTHKVHPHPDVVDTELEGQETVLLHLESKRYFSLNPTGTRIWRGLRQELNLHEISGRLQEEFVVEPEQADGSVLALVDELCRHQLVVGVD